MSDFSNLVRSRQTFMVNLVRKASMNEHQNSRRRVEYVKANDWREAKAIALAMPKNLCFVVEGQPKEIL